MNEWTNANEALTIWFRHCENILHSNWLLIFDWIVFWFRFYFLFIFASSHSFWWTKIIFYLVFSRHNVKTNRIQSERKCLCAVHSLSLACSDLWINCNAMIVKWWFGVNWISRSFVFRSWLWLFNFYLFSCQHITCGIYFHITKYIKNRSHDDKYDFLLCCHS